MITKGNFGGAQRYVYDLATNAPEGFETLVAYGEGDSLADALRDRGVRSIKIDRLTREISFFDEFKVCANLVKLILTEQPAVIHLNSSKIGGIGAVAGRIASFLKISYKPKIIFTSHGWGFNEKHRSLLSRTFYTLSHWLTLILVHKTIAVSKKTKRDVSWMPLASKKIVVIHNGIEKFKLKNKKEARSLLLGEDLKKIVIFSISELHKNKGLDIAINAISKLPLNISQKIVYCIAGEGEERKDLENLTEELGIRDSIRFLGFRSDARELLSGTDVFLFPSRTENLPYAVLEAGISGLPIVATAVGGIPEIISNMEDGVLVHPRSSHEITEAIIYLIENKDKMKIFKEKIQEKITQKFSLEKMLLETYALYSA